MHKYIYNIYIYIICTNPRFLWLELLGWLPFFLDCVGFSLRRLQLFQSTHLFSFKLTVLCQINTFFSDFPGFWLQIFHQFFQTSHNFPPIFGFFLRWPSTATRAVRIRCSLSQWIPIVCRVLVIPLVPMGMLWVWEILPYTYHLGMVNTTHKIDEWVFHQGQCIHIIHITHTHICIYIYMYVYSQFFLVLIIPIITCDGYWSNVFSWHQQVFWEVGVGWWFQHHW